MKFRKSTLSYFVIITLFAILGNMVGEAIGKSFNSVKFLSSSYTFGNTQPLTLDLGILNITMGIKLNFNILTMVFIIVALIIIKKS